MASSSAGLASGQSYTINSVKVQFPCKAYPSQLSMMDKVKKLHVHLIVRFIKYLCIYLLLFGKASYYDLHRLWFLCGRHHLMLLKIVTLMLHYVDD